MHVGDVGWEVDIVTEDQCVSQDALVDDVDVVQGLHQGPGEDTPVLHPGPDPLRGDAVRVGVGARQDAGQEGLRKVRLRQLHGGLQGLRHAGENGAIPGKFKVIGKKIIKKEV